MYLLTPTLQALSLIAWYLDSPPTAHHGLRLANCSSLSLTCLAESQKALHDFQQRKDVEYFAKNEEARGKEVERFEVTGRRDGTVRVKINGEGNVSIEVDREDFAGLRIWLEDGRRSVRVDEGWFRREEGGDETEVQKAGSVASDRAVGGAGDGAEWVYVHVRWQPVDWVVFLPGLVCVFLMHYLLYLVGEFVWRWCWGGGRGWHTVGMDQKGASKAMDDAATTVDLEEDDDKVKMASPCCGGDGETGPQSVGAHRDTSPNVVENAGSAAVLEEDEDDEATE